MKSAIEDLVIAQPPVDYFEQRQKGHGRDTLWSVRVYEANIGQVKREWKNIKRVIHVHRLVYQAKDRQVHSDRYYISDLKSICAAFFHQGIRKHWTIENRLHWVKDVVHGEDKNRIRTSNGPVNMAIMSAIAINIHRKNGNESITNGQIKFCCRLQETIKTIRT